MKNRHALTTMTLAALLALSPSAATVARQQTRPQQQQQQRRGDERNRDDDVIRITSDLVQVDAVVKDEKGRHVTDLTAEDFEIYENERPQKITEFTYVAVQPDPKAAPGDAKAAPPAPVKGAPRPPLRREETRRTIALVVDDLCSSFGSVSAVRDSLNKFVEEQMRPGDLVAVLRVRGGNSVLQQFTSDRNLLRRAAGKVRWYPPPPGVDCHGDFHSGRDQSTNRPDWRGDGSNARSTFETAAARGARERNEDSARGHTVSGVLGVLGLTLRAMRAAPGRKSLVLFSDVLPMVSREGRILSAYDEARRIVDAANRAGAVIYTVDPRGVTNPGFSPADQAAPTAPPLVSDDVTGASSLLAEGTGGLFLHTNNDLNQLLGRVLQDQSGYYLVGYRPSEESLRKGRDTFRDVRLKVKRPGVTVRARKGFFAPEVEEPRRAPAGTDRELYEVLVALGDRSDIEMRLTAGFKDAPATGPVVRTLLHVDGRALTLSDEPNGWKKLVLDVAAATIREDGRVADEFTRTHTVRLDPAGARVVRENGLTYAADVPVKKPGGYQFRIVLRDAASQRVGSASQFLEAPDLAKRDALALSGITLREAAAAAAERANAAAETALAAVTSPADPAVRRFRPGAVLAYDYQIYTGPPSKETRLTTQTQLYRDGQLLFTSPEEPFDAAARTAGGRLSDSRLFKLGERAAPGDYAIQVLVHEIDPKGKRRTASQWVDFEVVK